MHQFVLVHAQDIYQPRSQDPLVQPLNLARPRCRISGIEEGDSLPFLLGNGEDLLSKVRSLHVLIPVEDTDKIRFGYDPLVFLSQLFRAKLGQGSRIADHDVHASARVLCLERHCPGQGSRRPNVREIDTFQEVLQDCLAEFVCLNNRDDLTAKLRELSHHVRSVSPTPHRMSPAQKISGITTTLKPGLACVRVCFSSATASTVLVLDMPSGSKIID